MKFLCCVFVIVNFAIINTELPIYFIPFVAMIILCSGILGWSMAIDHTTRLSKKQLPRLHETISREEIEKQLDEVFEK